MVEIEHIATAGAAGVPELGAGGEVGGFDSESVVVSDHGERVDAAEWGVTLLKHGDIFEVEIALIGMANVFLEAVRAFGGRERGPIGIDEATGGALIAEDMEGD